MRYLASLSDGEQSRLFSNHLTAVGVANTLEEDDKGWTLWVEREDHLDRARDELTQFRVDPAASRYSQAEGIATARRAEEEKERKRLQLNYIDVRTGWSKSPQFGFPVTAGLIALSVLVALGSQFAHSLLALINTLLLAPIDPARGWNAMRLLRHGEVQTLLELAWDGAIEIRHGQVWRLVTPIFVHFSFYHLLFNMWWLVDLGRLIETRKGSIQMATLVLVSAVVSNLGEYLWSGPYMGGMSGVVYALLGYLWLKGLLQPHEGLGVSHQTVLIMVAWLVICMTGVFGSIANVAHVMGLVVGVVAGSAPYVMQRLRRGIVH